VRARTVTKVGAYLLCSCGFFQRFGLPCRHLFAVLERGPRPSDCATRWRSDYLAYGLTGKPELDRLFKEAKMQEPLGPFYCDDSDAPISYPSFIRGAIRDMKYFTGLMERTLYYAQGCDDIQQSTVVGRIVPEEELPSALHLSQLSQDLSEEDPAGGVEDFLENTHAYTLLYPTFKQIICLTTGDRKLESCCYQSLQMLHKNLLTKLAPTPNSDHTNEENNF
jgi:hypothetical protein